MTANSFPSQIRTIISGLFLALLFVVVCLPTGSILGLNVKVIAFGTFFAVFLVYLILGGDTLSSGDVIFLTLVAASLCFWTLVGLLNGQADTGQIFSHCRQMASAIVIAWLSVFFIRKGIVRAESLITVVIRAVFALSAMKLVLVAAAFFSNIDPIQVTQSVFGQESLVPGNIPFGLFRMQFSADILGAFALFALLARSVSGVRFGRVPTLIVFVVVLGSGFIAYSRFLWFLYFIAIFAAIMVQRSWKMLALTALAALALCASFYDVFYSILDARFLSSGTEISDTGRVEQYKALIIEIKARPLLGKGMGAHVNTNISSQLYMYSYELQWLAFLMQFGIVGEIGLLLLVAASARDLVAARHGAKPWLCLLFLLWLVAGWTNPYLTSSFAGATFGLFMAMFYRMRNISPGIESTLMPLVPNLQPS